MLTKKLTLIAVLIQTLLGCSTVLSLTKAPISPVLLEYPQQLSAVKSTSIYDITSSLGECIVKYIYLSDQVAEIIKYHESD
jgi:hypothetical protein